MPNKTHTKNTYTMGGKVWIYQSAALSSPNAKIIQGAWHFLSLPKKQSAEIKKIYGEGARGWGSLPIVVTVGKTSWKTSIFPDKKLGAYLLPLKAAVRRKEGITDGDILTFTVAIRV